MLQNHARIVNNPFQVQDGTIDFHITEYKKFIVQVDSTWHLTFKKPPLVKWWCGSKEYPKYLKRLLKFLSLFQLLISVKLIFFIHFT